MLALLVRMFAVEFVKELAVTLAERWAAAKAHIRRRHR